MNRILTDLELAFTAIRLSDVDGSLDLAVLRRLLGRSAGAADQVAVRLVRTGVFTAAGDLLLLSPEAVQAAREWRGRYGRSDVPAHLPVQCRRCVDSG